MKYKYTYIYINLPNQNNISTHQTGRGSHQAAEYHCPGFQVFGNQDSGSPPAHETHPEHCIQHGSVWNLIFNIKLEYIKKNLFFEKRCLGALKTFISTDVPIFQILWIFDKKCFRLHKGFFFCYLSVFFNLKTKALPCAEGFKKLKKNIKE